MKKFTEKEHKSLLKYVARKSKETTVPLVKSQLIKDYVKHSKTKRSALSILSHFNTFTRHPRHAKLFCTETIARMLFATRSPVEPRFLKKLSKRAELLELDKKGVIKRYKNGELELSAESEHRAAHQSLLEFVAQKALEATEPLNEARLWKEYCRAHGLQIRSLRLSEVFRSRIAPFIHSSSLDLLTKIRILFAMSYPLSSTLLKEFTEIADVLKVNEKNVIVKFQLGELVLSALDDWGYVHHTTRRTRIIELKGAELERALWIVKKPRVKKAPVVCKSVRNILKQLIGMVEYIASRELDELELQLNEAVEQLREEDKMIPVTIMHKTLKNIYNSLLPTEPIHSSAMTNSQFSIRVLRCIVTSMKLAEFDDIQKNIDDVLMEYGDEIKKTPVRTIRTALEKALLDLHGNN